MHPVHARVDGPLVMIGFGSIGRGTLPLIERHIAHDRSRFTVIEPSADFVHLLRDRGITHLQTALTPENLASVLTGLFPEGGGMVVNLSVDVDSTEVMRLCQRLGTLYIDTVIEPWPGFYFGSHLPNAERTNWPLREKVRAMRAEYPGGPTSISCCGANPGMVSWLLKEALTELDRDTGGDGTAPQDREGWARLAMRLGVRGVHVAERDTQVSAKARPPGVFVNTWSVDGLISEGYQPAELGWGTHERRLPRDGHGLGPEAAAIWIDRPGADTRVRSWCPGLGPQFGFVVTHNEALSIPDYFTVRDDSGRALYRPTCHYAYHPCADAILSLHEANGAGRLQERRHILAAEEIVAGGDDLGVLLYGHARGAMWYGSRLSIDEARALAPYQNATGLQVSSAVMAAMVWAAENPRAGIVEAEEMDHARCLEVQRPYLGRIEKHYTDWTPLSHRINRFAEDRDEDDPWQFTNFLVI